MMQGTSTLLKQLSSMHKWPGCMCIGSYTAQKLHSCSVVILASNICWRNPHAVSCLHNNSGAHCMKLNVVLWHELLTLCAWAKGAKVRVREHAWTTAVIYIGWHKTFCIKVLGCVDDIVPVYEHGPDNMVNSAAWDWTHLLLAIDSKGSSW